MQLDSAACVVKTERKRVMKAVKQNGYALGEASDALKADRELVMEAVKQNGYALSYASGALKADREIVMEAVKTNGYALGHASDALKADREVVMAAVKQDGMDRRITKIQKNGFVITFAANVLKKDRLFIREAMLICANAFWFIPIAMRRDAGGVRAWLLLTNWKHVRLLLLGNSYEKSPLSCLPKELVETDLINGLIYNF